MLGDAWIDPLLVGEKDVVHFKLSDVEEIPGVLNRCAAMGAETIVVNGGDGTADLVFAGLLNHGAYNHLPALALLPAGKTNMTTAGWSLTGKPENSLRALLDTRRAQSLFDYATERPVLGVHRGGSQPPLYGAFFGAAEVVSGILFCRRHIYPLNMPNALSHAAAVSILFWRSMAASRTGEHIKVFSDNGMKEEGSFFAVAVTALDQLLLGVRPRPEASEHSRGPLTYLSLRAGIYSTLRTMGSLVSRSIAPGTGRTVCSAGQLTMNFDGAYTLDGELYKAKAGEPLVLDGSKRLRFIKIPRTAQK